MTTDRRRDNQPQPDDRVVDVPVPSEAEPSTPQRRADTSSSVVVSAERIAQRAYEIYQERGGEHGLDTDDWFRAEAELNNTPS